MRRIIRTMTRIAAVVFSLALASVALAQTPDLKVTLAHPASVRTGDIATLTATVENAGSATARNVRVDLRISPGRQCDQTIVLGDLAPGERRTLSCSQEVLDLLYYLEFTAGAGSEPSEPLALQADNLASAFAPRLTVGTDLALYIGSFPSAGKPGLPVPLFIGYWNNSFTPATNATVTFTLSEGTFAPNLPAGCTVAGTRAVCRLGAVPAAPLNGTIDVRTFGTLYPIAPDRSEAQWSVDVELRSDQTDERPENNFERKNVVNYRTFFVREATHEALRSALASAAACQSSTLCLVAFRIPTAAPTKWHTIRLTSQLFFLSGMNILIDGTTQTGYFGDTNPDGPEIEIDGSATIGDGFRVPSRCAITLRGLTLNGFRGSAVLVHDGVFACLDTGPTLIEDNYIGTDPTGRLAKPNERGVYSFSQYGLTARYNVISGNTRSAVYIERGRGLIANNIIGLSRRHDAPLPNGASGVYVAADGDGTDVNDNYIGFNAHFGVAIDRGAEHVALHGNSFQANGGLAIDWGLDGPDEVGGRVRTPSIRSVRYANGVTTIEVDAQPASSFPVVSFYASDGAPDPSGFGEGQYFLGTSRAPFRLEVPQDLRGKWVAVTLTDVNTLQIVRGNDNSNVLRTTTSEFSRAVEVPRQVP